MQRRSFIEMFVAGTAGFIGFPEFDSNQSEELKWKRIRKQFPDANSTVLNLNNGSAGMIPSDVEFQLQKLNRIMNTMAPYEAVEIWNSINTKSRQLLAKQIGAHEEEIAIVRNTTEALIYSLRGIDIPKNSTIICARHDYGHALNILQRLSEEKEFKIKYVDLIVPASKDEIIAAYESVIDQDSSLVFLTAMTHREGQIIPIKEITKIAKANGALVVVDAAHAIGQFEHSVADWDCDYYCSSLHKWLSCPIGSGLLYVKQNLISSTRGSYSADKSLDDKMTKFEDVGTKPFSIEACILSALNFQTTIGLPAKNKRLKALSDYWVKGVKDIPWVTTFKPEDYGAIVSFHCPGKSKKIMDHLNSRDIHIKKVNSKFYPKATRTRYRVSPNIYHDFKDLDRLIDALKFFQAK